METTGDLVIGQIVKSKAGRDKDRLFVVIDLFDDVHVLVADGDLRKLEKPKKKKVKHLQKYNKVITQIALSENEGQKLENIEIRRAIEMLQNEELINEK